jgi:WD40 repeat protein
MNGQFDPYQSWLEIAPQGRPATHYELLGLPGFTSDLQKIQDAATARIAHVRKYQAGQYSDVAIRVMNEISQALTCLQNPAEKAAYDRQLRGFETIDDAATAALTETAAGAPEASDIPPLSSDLLGSASNASLDRLSALVAATEPLPNSSAYAAASLEKPAEKPAEEESNGVALITMAIGAAAVLLLLVIGSFGAYRLVAGSSQPIPPEEPQAPSETTPEVPAVEPTMPGPEAVAPNVDPAPTSPGPGLPPIPGSMPPAAGGPGMPAVQTSSREIDAALAASRTRWEAMLQNPAAFMNQTGQLTARFTQAWSIGNEARMRVDLNGRTEEFALPAQYEIAMSSFQPGQVLQLEYLVLRGKPIQLNWVQLYNLSGSRISIPPLSSVASAPGPAVPVASIPGSGVPGPAMGPMPGGTTPPTPPQAKPAGLLLSIGDQTTNRLGSTAIMRMAWSPDGSKLALGGSQCTIVDATSGNQINMMPGSVSSNGELVWSPNSSLLAVINDLNQWTLCEPATGQQLMTYQLGAAGGGSRTAFAPDGNEVLLVAPQIAGAAAMNVPRMPFGGQPNLNITSVLTWDIIKRRPTEEIKNIPAVQAIALSPDGKTLLVGTFSALYLFRQSSGRWGTAQQVPGAASGMSPKWLPGKQGHFTAINSNSLLTLFDAKNFKKAPVVLGMLGPQAAFSRDGERVASVVSGFLTVSDLEDARAQGTGNARGRPAARPQPTMPGAGGQAFAAAFSQVSEHLATGYYDGRIAIQDESGLEVANFSAGQSVAAMSLAWSPSGDRLASGHYGKVCIWDTSKLAGSAPASDLAANPEPPAAAGALRPEVSDLIKQAQKAIIDMDWATANALVEQVEGGELTQDERLALNSRVKKVLTSKADRLIQQAGRTKDPDEVYRLMSEAMDIDPNGPAGKKAANALKLNP